MWHSRRVTSATAQQQIVALYPAIKAEWTALLKGEPTLTPLGRPDTLIYLMDATLAQLTAGLQHLSTQHWLGRCKPLVGPMHTYCACGLNPLLKYFTTGELALRAVAGPVLGQEIEPVLERFQALAHREIETLCAVCQHKDSPECREYTGRRTSSR